MADSKKVKCVNFKKVKSLEDAYSYGYAQGWRDGVSRFFLNMYEDDVESALNIEGIKLSDKDEDQ